MENLIHENLSTGATTEEIYAFIDSKFDYDYRPATSRVTIADGPVLEAGYPVGTPIIQVGPEDCTRYLIFECEIFINFILDDEGKLRDYIVEEYIITP